MYVLPELPYAYDALAPLISRETLHTHHEKHHKTYVDRTNDLAAKAGLAGRPLEEGFGHFGSGWVWLVTGSEGLKVISTHDADDTLVREGLFPLLVCDLWEHAYYLDYKNDRKAFLERWFESLANWDFAAAQLAAADGRGARFRYPVPETERPDADKGEGPRLNA